MPRSTKAPAATSPQAKLSAVIKSARDAMRKDAGLNGDIDRIPQLAWLLFLKAFDGLEANREVVETKFRPAIEAPYRWRDWAADPNGRTGDALIEFVNGELLPYLRELVGTGSHDPRDVLAAVFKETYNRMLSGYLLRDVVNKVNEVNFASSDDIHTMAHLYESMLREMRDAAGDSGEFYTPRPVIRFMVQQVDPKLGEIVLDPACGTGGFLVEALEHLRPQVSTVKQQRALEGNLRGIEKKPLPYLLGMMNLVLHGVGQPNIVRGNALARADHPDQQARPGRRRAHQPAVRRRGGEEHPGQLPRRQADRRDGVALPAARDPPAQGRRPLRHRRAERRALRRRRRRADQAAAPDRVQPPHRRAAARRRVRPLHRHPVEPPVLREDRPNEGGVVLRDPAARGPKEVLEDQANALRGVRRLPGMVGTNRTENERAWRVPIADIEASGFNLDLKNPNRTDDLAHRPPQDLIAELVKTEEGRSSRF